MLSRLPMLDRPHSRTAIADGDKSGTKLLVEQFYRGRTLKQSSLTDLSNLTSLPSSRADLDSTADKSLCSFGSAKSDQDLLHALGPMAFRSTDRAASAPSHSAMIANLPRETQRMNSVYLFFDRVDLHAVCPEHVSETLTNINRSPSSCSLQPVVDAVDQTLQALWARIGRHFGAECDVHPAAQLLALLAHLNELQNNVKAMNLQLIDMTAEIKSRYLVEIQKSIQKLEHVDQLVRNLSLRLTAARETMARSRRELLENVAQKVAVLQEVSARFHEYDRRNRKWRFQQFIAALSVLVLALATTFVSFCWFSAP